jgi:hypothetical protein
MFNQTTSDDKNLTQQPLTPQVLPRQMKAFHRAYQEQR